jgi:hypothetical protein
MVFKMLLTGFLCLIFGIFEFIHSFLVVDFWFFLGYPQFFGSGFFRFFGLSTGDFVVHISL